MEEGGGGGLVSLKRVGGNGRGCFAKRVGGEWEGEGMSFATREGELYFERRNKLLYSLNSGNERTKKFIRNLSVFLLEILKRLKIRILRVESVLVPCSCSLFSRLGGVTRSGRTRIGRRSLLVAAL